MNIIDYVEKHGELASFNKQQHLIHQGEHDHSLYFIKSGLIKAYYLTVDGKEFIKSFISEEQIIGSLTSLHNHQASTFSMVCLEDTEAFKIDFKHFHATALNDAQLNQIMIEILLKLVQKKEKREYEFLCLSAEKRYQILQSDNPGLVDRLTQNDIAKYLGVTAVGLSRIKTRNQ